MGLEQGPGLCSAGFEEARSGQTTTQGIMKRPSPRRTKNALSLVALPSHTGVWGLPVIAFCLQKETFLRKKPITPAPWRQLDLSLLPSKHPSAVGTGWRPQGTSQPLCATPPPPSPLGSQAASVLARKALNCVAGRKEATCPRAPPLGSEAFLTLLCLFPDCSFHIFCLLFPSRHILSQT